jgi:hypothetical protein
MQLERSFHLNDADRELVDERRRDHTGLGFGVQLGTVRFLGTFLTDSTTDPAAAEEQEGDAQLGISDDRGVAHRAHGTVRPCRLVEITGVA